MLGRAQVQHFLPYVVSFVELVVLEHGRSVHRRPLERWHVVRRVHSVLLVVGTARRPSCSAVVVEGTATGHEGCVLGHGGNRSLANDWIVRVESRQGCRRLLIGRCIVAVRVLG